MANLTLRHTAHLGPTEGMAPLLSAIEDLLVRSLRLPVGATNVMAVKMETGPNAAPVFIELTYRAAPDRSAQSISEMGRLIASMASDAMNCRVEFRGFPLHADQVVACRVLPGGAV